MVMKEIRALGLGQVRCMRRNDEGQDHREEAQMPSRGQKKTETPPYGHALRYRQAYRDYGH
jgi:hypothetical protein